MVGRMIKRVSVVAFSEKCPNTRELVGEWRRQIAGDWVAIFLPPFCCLKPNLVGAQFGHI